jgi:hypothetical protein
MDKLSLVIGWCFESTCAGGGSVGLGARLVGSSEVIPSRCTSGSMVHGLFFSAPRLG